jgi:hypothetical protein
MLAVPFSYRDVRAATQNRGVSATALAGSVIGWLVVQQLLLLRFLGFDPIAIAAGVLVASVLLAGCLRAGGWARERVGWGTIAALFALSLLVFALGGEARLFYANTDWQVRGAVLRDLVEQPWPFAYAANGGLMLRLPLGLYLLPAIVGKAAGERAAEWAMLVQNAAVLTALLALARPLFATTRTRVIALAVVVAFSGMDVVGAWLAGVPLTGHLEQWAYRTQFSSHLTQAFWAPQHALAGWLGALLYLLWRTGRAPAAAVLVVVPLTALLSPLALIGLLPFAAQVGVATLHRHGLGWRELVPAGAASALSVPALLYLSAAGETVGGVLARPRAGDYLVFELLEVGVPLYAWWRTRATARFGGATLAITAAALVLLPFAQVGDSVDLVMRASIPALLVLAVVSAELLTRADVGRRLRGLLAAVLLIGAATPVSEVVRALTWPRAPAVLCGYLGVVPGGAATYVARLDRLPAAVRPSAPALVTPHDPPHCWDGAWPEPTR